MLSEICVTAVNLLVYGLGKTGNSTACSNFLASGMSDCACVCIYLPLFVLESSPLDSVNTGTHPKPQRPNHATAMIKLKAFYAT